MDTQAPPPVSDPPALVLGMAAAPTPFYENISEPVDALISDLPLPHGEELPKTNGTAVVTQESSSNAGNTNLEPDNNNRSHDDDNDLRRPDSPLSPQDSDNERVDSTDSLIQPEGSQTEKRPRKTARVVLIVGLVSAILIILSLSGTYIVLEYSHQNMKNDDSNTTYTRTGVYVLLKTFACGNDICNVSEVKAKIEASAEPDQIKIFLTNCENIIYNMFEENSESYTQELYHANSPIDIIDENFVAQNYFRGNTTIFARTKIENFANQVYICQFADPVVFKEFLSSNGDWNHLTYASECIKLSGMYNTSYSYSVAFHNEYLRYSFVGAVQSNPPQDIHFGFKVIGEKTAGFTDANCTQTCTLNAYGTGDESECSIYISDELAHSATGSELCVLGYGVSAGDGHFQYTPIIVELIEHKMKISFITKLRIAFISPITIIILLVSGVLIAVGVCKRHKKVEVHYVSAVAESGSERNRSMIAAFNVRRQNNSPHYY